MTETITLNSNYSDRETTIKLKQLAEAFHGVHAAQKIICINIYSGNPAENHAVKKNKIVNFLGRLNMPLRQIRVNLIYNPFLSREIHLNIYNSAEHPHISFDYLEPFDSDNFIVDDDPQKGFDAALKKAIALLPAIEKKYTAGSDEYKYCSRAVNVYKDSGVKVEFNKLTQGTLGSTIGTFRDYKIKGQSFPGTYKNTALVTIDDTQNKKGTDLLNTIAHEGSHAQDYLDYQGAKIKAFPYSNEEAANLTPEEAQKAANALDAALHGTLRITHEESETRAYIVSSVFAEFTIGGGTGEDAFSSTGGTTTWKFNLPPEISINVGGEAVWKSSWKKNSNDKIREDRMKAIKAGLVKDTRYSRILNDKILDNDVQ